MMIPVPLHPTRLRERGYNQSCLLADGISSAFGIPIVLNKLTRIRNTEPQAMLEAKNRFTNIHGAFTIKNSQGITRKNILIIDDLLTTGATASEAARILKTAGAKRVGVLTLAITA